MTILEFSTKIAAKVPSGWSYWAGSYALDYNREKTAADTVLMVLPNWPVYYRTDMLCQSNIIRVDFWFLKYTGIDNTTTGTQQHNPNQSLEHMVTVESVINAFFTSLQTDSSITVKQVSDIEFLPTPVGGTANAQSVSKVTATLLIQ
jgi:hypothetical protein